MNLHPFVKAVADLKFENCFNPYSDRCEVHDVIDAPIRRGRLLSAMLERATMESVDAIWIGRDLGYRGGRRTGLALTDDVHVGQHTRRWDVDPDRVTCGQAVAERTAAVIWSKLEVIDARIFLWNVFPLHPHEADQPFSNRQHNARERAAGEELLGMLISLLRPQRIVAIGNDAAAAARRVTNSVSVTAVRHPSYGGQTQFLREIDQLYGEPRDQQSLF